MVFSPSQLVKADVKFQSFGKASDSRMKEMTAASIIGTNKTSADPLIVQDEEQLWSSGTIGFHSWKALNYSVYFYNCKVFGFRARNEHDSLMAEQYEFGSDKDNDFITFNGRISKNDQRGLQQRKIDVKLPNSMLSHPTIDALIVSLFREYLKCILNSGRFYRKPLQRKELGDISFGEQRIAINILSKYLKSL